MFVYILTNKNRTVLYTGVTNNLTRRQAEHYENARTTRTSFAGRYNAYHLVYYEEIQSPLDAIAREKEIKKWRREKKVKLIESFNPKWEFLET